MSPSCAFSLGMAENASSQKESGIRSSLLPTSPHWSLRHAARGGENRPHSFVAEEAPKGCTVSVTGSASKDHYKKKLDKPKNRVNLLGVTLNELGGVSKVKWLAPCLRGQNSNGLKGDSERSNGVQYSGPHIFDQTLYTAHSTRTP